MSLPAPGIFLLLARSVSDPLDRRHDAAGHAGPTAEPEDAASPTPPRRRRQKKSCGSQGMIDARPSGEVGGRDQRVPMAKSAQL